MTSDIHLKSGWAQMLHNFSATVTRQDHPNEFPWENSKIFQHWKNITFHHLFMSYLKLIYKLPQTIHDRAWFIDKSWSELSMAEVHDVGDVLWMTK